MELRGVLEKRSSVRQYADEPVSVDDLREMVRMAGRAPSVNNTQPWRFIAITNRELLASMAEMVHTRVNDILPNPLGEGASSAKSEVDWFSTFFGKAPAVIAVAACPYTAIVDRALIETGFTHDNINAMRGHPDIQSIGASIQTLILAAVDMGYGACWLSGPLIARESLEKALGIEEPWRLAAMVAVGRPRRDVPQSPKKPLEEIFEIRE